MVKIDSQYRLKPKLYFWHNNSNERLITQYNNYVSPNLAKTSGGAHYFAKVTLQFFLEQTRTPELNDS